MSFAEFDKRLRNIEDRIAIEDLICELGMRADLKQFDKIPSLLMTDALFDYSDLYGEEFKDVPISAFTEGRSGFQPGFDAAHHQKDSFLIEIDGDSATAYSQLRATHRIGDRLWVVGGTYFHELARAEGRWKVARATLKVAFQEGERLDLEARRRLGSSGR